MGHGAEMNGCGKCLKYLMFTFNLLSLVSSIFKYFNLFSTLVHKRALRNSALFMLYIETKVKMGLIEPGSLL